MFDEGERTTEYRPSAYPCPTCGAPPEKQTLARVPTGHAWRCGYCNNETSASLPFDPKAQPDGKEQIYLAIETLAVYVPILQAVDRDLIYRVVRPYFAAGWCVRDVIYALNYL